MFMNNNILCLFLVKNQWYTGKKIFDFYLNKGTYIKIAGGGFNINTNPLYT